MEVPMELFQLTHIPMSIAGGLLFFLGLMSFRFTRQAVQGPRPPRWAGHDMVCLLLGAAITLPLALGLGLMLTALVSGIIGQGESLVALATMAVIALGGIHLARRGRVGVRPAQA
jgi:hypothetical protein